MADALQLIKDRVRLAHRQALSLAESVTADQLAWRPTPRAHSIAWTLWHIARCADQLGIEMAAPGTDRTEIWTNDDLARRWKLEPAVFGINGAGTEVSDDVAATVAPPARDELLGYARRAFESEESTVDAIDTKALAREYDSGLLQKRTTVGESLLICLTHENRHLGELEYVKGLLGLRGTVSR